MRRSRATTCADVGAAGLKTLTNPSIAGSAARHEQPLFTRNPAVVVHRHARRRQNRTCRHSSNREERRREREQHARQRDHDAPADERRVAARSRKHARTQEKRGDRDQFHRYNPSAANASCTAFTASASFPIYVRPDARKCPPPPKRAAAACTLTRPLLRKLTRMSPSYALNSAATSTPSTERKWFTISSVSSPSASHCESMGWSTYDQMYRPSSSRRASFNARPSSLSAAMRLLAKISSVICSLFAPRFISSAESISTSGVVLPCMKPPVSVMIVVSRHVAMSASMSILSARSRCMTQVPVEHSSGST